MDADPVRFRKHGRNRATMYTVAAVWIVLLALVIAVDAAPWLMALIGLTTLPALWDLYRNPFSGLDFTSHGLQWFSGSREGAVAWSEIERVRLDTRLDFSVRVSLRLRSGKKICLPFECTPDHTALEAAFKARGIRTERHHFSLVG